VGIGEEVMILVADTLEPAPKVTAFLNAVQGRDLRGVLKSELHASIIELACEVSDDTEEAVERLAVLRRTADDIAAENGLRIAAAGSHPTSKPLEQEIAPDERYRDFVAYAGPTARRQGVSGLHVHIGMPDADACYRV